MDELLLNELYGNVESADDEQVKLAQAEFVEQAALEAGIDIDTLNDDELSKFAEYVLDNNGVSEEQQYSNLTQEQALEADEMGRIMAHSYADELNKIASYEGDEEMTEEQYVVSLALQDIANAWDEELDGEGFVKSASADIALEFIEAGEPELAYIQMLDSEEFAKEAEYRASEILLACGIDPITLEDVEPEYIKLASFPSVEDADNYATAEVLAEYNDKLDTAAEYIIECLVGSIFG
jgi:hypothetical protein